VSFSDDLYLYLFSIFYFVVIFPLAKLVIFSQRCKFSEFETTFTNAVILGLPKHQSPLTKSHYSCLKNSG